MDKGAEGLRVAMMDAAMRPDTAKVFDSDQ